MSRAADAEARTGPKELQLAPERQYTAAQNEHIEDTLYSQKQRQIAMRGLHTEQLLRVQVPGPDTGGLAMILQRFRLLLPDSGDHLRQCSL